MAYTKDDAVSLGEKLAGLELTEGEAEALGALLELAAGEDRDVEGFVDAKPKRIVSGPIPLPMAVPKVLGE